MDARQKERWEKKGKRFQVTAVMEQARVSVSLGQNHESELETAGWPKARTDGLSSRISELDGFCSTRAFKVDASRSAARSEAECRKKAKAYIDKLRLSVPMVLRDHPAPGITEAAFKSGRTLGMSSAKIAGYLTGIRPFVAELEQHLLPYFGGESAVALLENVKTALEASDTAQETYRAGLPVTTARVHALVGEIVEMIEDLNRVAKIAFKDNPEIAAQFGKLLIDRAVRKKTNGSASDPTGLDQAV